MLELLKNSSTIINDAIAPTLPNARKLCSGFQVLTVHPNVGAQGLRPHIIASARFGG